MRQHLRSTDARQATDCLGEHLLAVASVDNLLDLRVGRLRVDNLVLASDALLVLLPAALLDLLVVLDGRDELGLDKRRLLPFDLGVTPRAIPLIHNDLDAPFEGGGEYGLVAAQPLQLALQALALRVVKCVQKALLEVRDGGRCVVVA